MADCMTFPEKWEDFIREYEHKDDKEVYTNGAMLIPSFRAAQMMEHYVAREAIVKLVKPDPEYPYRTWDIPCTSYRAIFWKDEYIGIYDAGKCEGETYIVVADTLMAEKDARIAALEKENEEKTVEIQAAERLIKKAAERVREAEDARDQAVSDIRNANDRGLCYVCNIGMKKRREMREENAVRLCPYYRYGGSINKDAQD